mmetsp:Transcript_38258/g.92284  ORF Transcript_38258/g.92284 Transcript_38258/m.92284 type:complete len:290 (-) Transcript_38258:4020-4889(-)
MIFGYILGLEFFDRIMCIGTYVITIGTILLQVVGPGIQDDQDIGELLRQPSACAWFLLLLTTMVASTMFMLHRAYEERIQIVILLLARSSSYTLNLTVSRAFLLNPNFFILVTFVVIKVVSGAIYTYAIVVQSTTVTQSKFVPLNATTIILVNALTGIVIWQDWRVIISWTGYICVFLLLALGCDLLLSANILTNENPDYGLKKQAAIIIESTPIKRIFALERMGGSRNLYEHIPHSNGNNATDGSGIMVEKGGVHNYLSRKLSMLEEDHDRRESWKKVLSLSTMDHHT